MFHYTKTHNICFIKKLIHINISLPFHVWELCPRALHYFSAEHCINYVPKCSNNWVCLAKASLLGISSSYQHWNLRREPQKVLCLTQSRYSDPVRNVFCWVKRIHFLLLLRSLHHDRKWFCTKHLTSSIPYKRKIYSIVENFQMTGSVLNKNKIQKPYVLRENKSKSPCSLMIQIRTITLS
jgi:hypothetical protein